MSCRLTKHKLNSRAPSGRLLLKLLHREGVGVFLVVIFGCAAKGQQATSIKIRLDALLLGVDDALAPALLEGSKGAYYDAPP